MTTLPESGNNGTDLARFPGAAEPKKNRNGGNWVPSYDPSWSFFLPPPPPWGQIKGSNQIFVLFVNRFFGCFPRKFFTNFGALHFQMVVLTWVVLTWEVLI